ncbi:unnamed protein product [Ectocarpus sp. CCAP 1310/34]|nr:unnamed protein product [Ectocarpus sp. CCAP 1310/34]
MGSVGAAAASGVVQELGVTVADGGATNQRARGPTNLVHKGMLFEALLEKVRDSHRLGYRGAKFTWKTRAVDCITEQKPLFDSVRKKWLQLPQESRIKYRCANYLDTPFPTESTARQAQQEARGNDTAIMESLQDQAQSQGERNVEDVERAEKHLEVARQKKDILEAQARDSAAREKARDAKTEHYRQQRLVAEADRAKKQDAQHEDLLDFMSSTFRTPVGGVFIQWDSYEKFWECLPDISQTRRRVS